MGEIKVKIIALKAKVSKVPTYQNSDCIGQSFLWILISKHSLHQLEMKIFKEYNHFITLKDTFYVEVSL
jgi:hypothetical protein